MTVRIGVIGLGSIGARHVGYLNSINGAQLAAICDPDRAKLEKFQEELPQDQPVAIFERYQDMLASKTVDAVIIATPHFHHPDIAIAAFAHDVHVMCEKPLAVSVREARRVVDAHALRRHLKFGLMFQQRTFPIYRTLRHLITTGQLGAISRVTWLITDWFRTWSYYESGGWRATWAGEGGGVLLNQCPHNLDLLYWLTGLMPSRVMAMAYIGKTHPIEVEDEVSAILEYPNGATGHFITTTGEAPGTNRLEIAGDQGRVVAENGRLVFHRTNETVRTARETWAPGTRTVDTHTEQLTLDTSQPQGHKAITQNFVNAILTDEPLIAPGHQGIQGLEIGNAILQAGLTRLPISLPLDPDSFEQFLQHLIQTSKYKNRVSTGPAKNAGPSSGSSATA